MAEPVAVGTKVTYHGSLAHHHGPATVARVNGDPFNGSDDGHRYTLATAGTPLYNARRQSFTVDE